MQKQIPNFFTLLNLLLGCVAIIYTFKEDDFLFIAKPGEFSIGLLIGGGCIFLAAVVDFLDGFVARLFHAVSKMGAQLDSFADAVTFGVAPAMIMYRLLQLAFVKEGVAPVGILYLLPALLIPCCAVWRLARFNLDHEQTYFFKGAPTPAVGLTFASLPFISNSDHQWAAGMISNLYFLYTSIIVLSVLMVSNLPLIGLKFKNFNIKNNRDKFILLAIAVLCIIFLQWVAVPVIFLAYVLVSLIFKPNRS